VREGDGVARTDPNAAAAAQVVDRPRNDPEPNAVELAKERRDLTRQGAVDQRFEKDGFGAVLALVHRDELAEDGISVLSTRPPSFDAADQSFRPRAQRRFDETFLRRRMQVDGPGRDVGAPRDLAHPEVGVSAARDLAQRGGLDRGRRSRRSAGALALNVSPIRYKPSVSE
jgi:hypothetical protein